MLIKLQRQQLEGVELLLGILINQNPPENVEERLVYDHVFGLYTKIRAKAENLRPSRSGWSISLTDFEAMAFHVFFRHFFADDERYRYEAIQLQQIFNQIDHQDYGRPAKTNIRPRNVAEGQASRLLGS